MLRVSGPMEEKKIKVKAFIKEELEREAEEIRQDGELSGGEAMPAEVKERIRKGLEEQIADYEISRRYPELSEEDRKALRLGHEMLEREKQGAKTPRKKRGVKFYLGLAAVLVMVLAVGIVSIGGPERVVRLVKKAVGEREVEQTDSSEDNLVIVEEDESEAYQEIEKEFNVYPVRIRLLPDEKMRFDFLRFDKEFQVAELSYFYENEKLIYIINASYQTSSWAIDLDDKVVQKYQIDKEGCPIEIKEYEIAESGEEKYSASFQYEGLEYFLLGTMQLEEFELIVNNLYFFPSMH